MVKVRFSVQYRIKDAFFSRYRVAQPRETVRDAAQAAIREVVGRTDIDGVLYGQKAVVAAQTRQVLDMVKRLADQGYGVVIISHNLHDIFEVSDRITVLRLGQQVAVFDREGTTQQDVVEAITAGELAHVPGMEEAAQG